MMVKVAALSAQDHTIVVTVVALSGPDHTMMADNIIKYPLSISNM